MLQFVRLVRSIGRIATAAHTAAPEEERELALRCLQDCLHPPPKLERPEHADRTGHEAHGSISSSSNSRSRRRNNTVEDVCTRRCLIDNNLRDFLQSKEAAPSLGYLLSLCIQVADEEATAAQLGSKALYGRALQTLRHLIETVRLAPALSLPRTKTTNPTDKLRTTRYQCKENA